VEVAGASIDKLLNELWNIRTGGPFSRKIADLLLTGNFAGQEKPEETFRKWL
jgi:hypothetical protein